MQRRGTPSANTVAMRQVLHLRGSRFPSWRQWKELPRFLSEKERRITNTAISVFALAVLALGAHLWFSHETALAAVGGSYTEGAIGTPQYINPLYATGSDVDADLTRLVYSGLMKTDGNHTIVPDLAQSYAVSDDQKTYTFTLRSDAKWHDGEPVTSSDVVYTLDAIQNPEFHSPLAVTFAGVAVEAPDPSTVVFTLEEPFSAFLAATTIGILPEHLWSEVVPQNAPLAQLNLKPIGSGPFVFSKLVKDNKGSLKSYTLERNTAFYGGTVYLNDITFKFYGDLQELTDAVKNKNVEGASVLSAQDAQSLAHDGVIHLGAANLSQFTAAFFNTKHSTVIADSVVRQALVLATDRTHVAEAAAGTLATPIVSPILTDMPGFDAAAAVPGADVATATALLESESWMLADGVTTRAKSGTAFAFTITTLDSPDLIAAATELQKEWQAIGAAVDVLTVDQSTLQTTVIKNHDYDVLLAGERYGTYPDLYPFWHSSQTTYPGLNLGGFADRKVDAAIAAARVSTDPQKAIDAAQLLTAAFHETIPAIMLYQPKYLYAVGSKLHGTDVTSVVAPADRFSNVQNWYRNTSRKLW